MVVNTAKCFTMLITPHIRKWSGHSNLTVTLNGKSLIAVESLKILGVRFSQDLSWVAHSNDVRLKMNCMISMIKRCGRSINYNTKIKIYSSFIAPHLNYCLPVWSHLPKTSCAKMSHCLARMLGCLKGDYAASFTASTFVDTGLREFNHAVAVRCCTTLFSALLDNTANSILCLNSCAATTSHMTRRNADANKLITTVPKRKADSYCFQSAASALWNQLPNSITHITSKGLLAKTLDKFYSDSI